MNASVEHSCRCGQTRLNIAVPAKSAGTRLRCYCADCQTAAHLHGDATDQLSDAGGTDIWQTTPDHLQITQGAEHLSIKRLSPKGLMRWYAGCCGTPMFNTLPNLKLPFVGAVLRQSQLATQDQTFGKVTCHAFVSGARPGQGAPAQDRGFKRAGVSLMRRMALAFISGRARLSPLRHADGTPIAPVDVITREARQAARPEHLR